MNSSQKLAKVERRGVVLVADGGVSRLPGAADPIQAWIELIEVVEALRPKDHDPPPRPRRRTVGTFRL